MDLPGDSRMHEELTEEETLSIACQEERKHGDLHKYLEKIGKGHGGPAPDVILRLAEEQVAVHSTVLAALSSFWRQFLHDFNKNAEIVHTLSVSLSSEGKVLSALKCLLYLGKATLSGISEENILAVLLELKIDDVNLTHEEDTNGSLVLNWTSHSACLVNGLQLMCTSQTCCDLSIFVDGHLIKGHKLVMGAFSPVLSSVFEENIRTKLLHLPGVSVENAQNLVSFMYFGKANIGIPILQEFYDLCSSLEVNSLVKLTKAFCSNTAKRTGEIPKKYERQKMFAFRILPEVVGILKRLQHLYGVMKKTDVTLLVENKKLSSHKAILSATCPSLHEMLTEEHSDDHTVICFSDSTYGSVRSLLSLIYNGFSLIAEKNHKFVCSYLDKNILKIEEQTGIPVQEQKKLDISERSMKGHKGLYESKPKKNKYNRHVVFRNSSTCRRSKFEAVKHYRKALEGISDDSSGNSISDTHDSEENFGNKGTHNKYVGNSGDESDSEKTICEENLDSKNRCLNRIYNCDTKNYTGGKSFCCLNHHLKKRIMLGAIGEVQHGIKRSRNVNSSPKVPKEVPSFLEESQDTKRVTLNSLYDIDGVSYCPQCGEQFQDTCALKRHKRRCSGVSVTKNMTGNHAVATLHSQKLGQDACLKVNQTNIYHSCEYCMESFATITLLTKHVAEAHSHKQSEYDAVCYPKGLVKCRECDQRFESRPLLYAHKKSYHKRKYFNRHTKNLLQSSSNNEQSFEESVSVDSQGPIPTAFIVDGSCKFCTYWSSDHCTLLKHVNDVHSSQSHQEIKGEVLQCDICLASFTYPDELLEHKNASHPDTLQLGLPCHLCNKIFLKKQGLSIHLAHCKRKQRKKRKRVVRKTFTRSTRKSRLSAKMNVLKSAPSPEHVRNILDEQHSPEDEKTVIPAGEPSARPQEADFIEFPIEETDNFSCPECGKVFNNIESFSLHAEEEGHGGLVGSCWICGICRSAFFEESELNEHLASHNPLPEYYIESDSPKKHVVFEDSRHIIEHSDLKNEIIESSSNSLNKSNVVEDYGNIKVKTISPYRVEADSSVMDGESSVDWQPSNLTEMTSDNETNVVTSSMSGEKTSYI